MRVAWILPLGTCAARAVIRDTFEPADFNVTEALIDNGVNVSAIPELAALSERSLSRPCSIACNSLKLIYGNKVLTGGTDYDAFTSAYWSTQATTVHPYCIFKPAKALEVSTTVLISRLTKCPFAIKSGGHTAFPGASSIEGGITVSLESLNEISLSADKRIAVVGPGNRWGRVYTTLAEYGLAVAGGRASDVGVGGLLLGGGVSHHSNIYGLGCDNIASFEIVTASGIILTVTPTQFPDLYWALRGGGNNFGVVTSFSLETITQGQIWGGFRIHLEPQYPALIEAFANMVESAPEDPKAVQILSFAVTAGSPAAQIELEYLSPVNNANPPAILKEYLSIPAVIDGTANRTLASATDNLSAQMPNGNRYSFWAATFKLDRDLMTWMREKHAKDVGSLPDQGSLTFQAFTVPAIKQMKKKGGNALGLEAANGPLFHVLLYMLWEDSTKDELLNKAAQTFINAAKAEGKRRGLASDYIYMNYAGPYQNVVPGYGAANLQRLKSVAKKYDPTAVFQTLQPGGFKLEGAPYGEVI